MENEISSAEIDEDIRQEPAMQQLLARMPTKVADSFTDLQLLHLKTAIGSRNWGKHAIDCRGTITFPFLTWRIYYVFLLGRNRRLLTDRERKLSAFFTALFILFFIIFCTTLGLLALYLIKSFAGIDIFPNFSLGIWSYFKDL